MKQGALHRFSRSALRGGFSEVMLPLVCTGTVNLSGVLLRIAGAYFTVRYFQGYIPLLIWCAAGMLIRILSVVLTAGQRGRIIRSCVLHTAVPCGYERGIKRGLLRLYFLRGTIRLALRLLTAAAVLSGVWVILCADFFEESLYRLLTGFQAVPALIVIICVRTRLAVCFMGAEVINAEAPEKGAWKCLRESCRMLSGQYGFIAAMLLRNILCMLVPFFLPVFIQTLVSYFSVRHIEWSYNSNEQTCFHGRHKRTRKARRLSQE